MQSAAFSLHFAHFSSIFARNLSLLRAFSFKEHAQAHVREREERERPEDIAERIGNIRHIWLFLILETIAVTISPFYMAVAPRRLRRIHLVCRECARDSCLRERTT